MPTKNNGIIDVQHHFYPPKFLAERRVRECPCRFDVVAIDNSPGKPPVVRLHKDAFSPQM